MDGYYCLEKRYDIAVMGVFTEEKCRKVGHIKRAVLSGKMIETEEVAVVYYGKE